MFSLSFKFMSFLKNSFNTYLPTYIHMYIQSPKYNIISLFNLFQGWPFDIGQPIACSSVRKMNVMVALKIRLNFLSNTVILILRMLISKEDFYLCLLKICSVISLLVDNRTCIYRKLNYGYFLQFYYWLFICL